MTPEARLIRGWRRFHNKSQEQVAEICGVSRRTIHNWEAGKTDPPTRKLATMLASIYNERGEE